MEQHAFPQEFVAAPAFYRARTDACSATRRVLLHLSKESLILVMSGAAGLLVYLTGGLPNAFAHFFYAPVLLAAYWFGATGAVATGVLCGLMAGPLMPPDALSATQQSTQEWLTRMAFLASIGGIAGILMTQRDKQRDKSEAAHLELYEAYGSTLKMFASLVAHRDEQTSHHCERVAHNAVVMGEALGMGEKDLRELHWAGILHDLGKISTPASILLKPGKLTEVEHAEIRKHAEVGASMLCSISERFETIAQGVRSHHERWDGTGYPDRLSRESIPVSGRIIHIVDVFEAITSKRPYRDPMHSAEALEVIRRGAGTDFDPELAAAFVELYTQGRIIVQGDQLATIEYEYPLPGFEVPADTVRRAPRLVN